MCTQLSYSCLLKIHYFVILPEAKYLQITENKLSCQTFFINTSQLFMSLTLFLP